jgi:hypothetical protein
MELQKPLPLKMVLLAIEGVSQVHAFPGLEGSLG